MMVRQLILYSIHLGVPSRMNVGQILETALGLWVKNLVNQLKELIETKGIQEIKKYLEEMSMAQNLLIRMKRIMAKKRLWNLREKQQKMVFILKHLCLMVPI